MQRAEVYGLLVALQEYVNQTWDDEPGEYSEALDIAIELLQTKRCMNCWRPADGATPTSEAQEPSPGDVAVCLYCGAIGVYDEMMLLNLASGEFFEALDPDEVRTLMRVREGVLKLGDEWHERS